MAFERRNFTHSFEAEETIPMTWGGVLDVGWRLALDWI